MSTTRRARDEPILSARDIVNRFGRQVVHDHVSLDILRGEVVGIAGGSGAGKSVLLKTLVGLHRPQAGQVLLDGAAIESLDDDRKASLIGMLFQQGALFSSLSVAQNVMLPLRHHSDLPYDEQMKVAAMKLQLAGLERDVATKYPAQLSGGMVKRAAFARALALDPPLLFLDEPTSDLDPLTAGGIDTLVLKLNQALGVTVVVVTHDLTTLFTVCDRLAVLADAKITVGTVEELMPSKDPWIRDFLHGPRAQGAMAARRQIRGNR